MGVCPALRKQDDVVLFCFFEEKGFILLDIENENSFWQDLNQGSMSYELSSLPPTYMTKLVDEWVEINVYQITMSLFTYQSSVHTFLSNQNVWGVDGQCIFHYS